VLKPCAYIQILQGINPKLQRSFLVVLCPARFWERWQTLIPDGFKSTLSDSSCKMKQQLTQMRALVKDSLVRQEVLLLAQGTALPEVLTEGSAREESSFGVHQR
jgi:hypothetical protein